MITEPLRFQNGQLHALVFYAVALGFEEQLAVQLVDEVPDRWFCGLELNQPPLAPLSRRHLVHAEVGESSPDVGWDSRLEQCCLETGLQGYGWVLLV